jgi:uncharacterized protein YycO
MPGDILLERRDWHAINIGIPGFWTHSALHMGTLEYLDEYFEGLDKLKGVSFSNYIEKNFPVVYDEWQKADEEGNENAVIESKRPGVIIVSLEESANVDSLVVLRAKNLDRDDHFKIITQALVHFGKPYDFDFDFVTDKALVCSELVSKAFTDIYQLNIIPQEINGRLVLSPNQIAEKFANEFSSDKSELELILFLDGDEKKGEAFEKNAEEFTKTWTRPKWHIVKDFMDF